MTKRNDKHEGMSSEGTGARHVPRGLAWVLEMLAGLGLSLPGCLGALGGFVGAETLERKEGVALHDGGTLIVTQRVQLVPGAPFKAMAGARRFTFSHPTTGQPIVWENAGKIGSRVIPGLLDFDAGRPILVTRAQAGPDYDAFGCPRTSSSATRRAPGSASRWPNSGRASSG
jgi:hypothetical protein